MNVGFIGIGQMGKHMSRHVLNSGYDLIIHDLRREAAQHLLDKGATWMDNPKGVAESCQVVLSCLPGPPDVEKVVYGKEGLLAGWEKGDIYVDMSTNSPTTIRQVAEDARVKGVEVLDAPVSGGVVGAEAGTLTIMVGGAEHSLEKVREVLEAIGSTIFHVGDIGCGNIVKLVNNMISISASAITAEGFVLGVKAGIDARKLQEVIRLSTGNNHAVQNYPKTVFRGNFEPGFRIALASKDISLALSLSREYGLPLPVAAAAEQRLLDAKTADLADKHIDALILRLEELARVQVRSPD
ncbi:NAD(P)-dependent oxidoreductase [Chloroflexota bacterium]